jgi:hypothetical protein
VRESEREKGEGKEGKKGGEYNNKYEGWKGRRRRMEGGEEGEKGLNKCNTKLSKSVLTKYHSPLSSLPSHHPYFFFSPSLRKRERQV